MRSTLKWQVRRMLLVASLFISMPFVTAEVLSSPHSDPATDMNLMAVSASALLRH